MLTLGFHARPVVWYSMTYLPIASSNAYHARTHSTCLGSLRKGKTRASEVYGTGDVLVLEILDNPIAVELGRLLHIFDVRARFWTLIT